jgi:hypothetical protein
MYPHGGYPSPEATKLAKRLRTLAIVQLAFGGIGLLGMNNGLIPPGRDPTQKKLHELMWGGEMRTWMIASTALGVTLTLLLVAAGYSLYRRKLVGRTLTIAHGAIAAVTSIGNYFITQDLLRKVFAEVAKNLGPAADVFIKAMSGVQVFSLLLGFALYIVEVYVVTRPGVKEHLSAPG